MNDRGSRLFAGHAGLCAVIVDILIDKGIVSQGELLDRVARAQSAAGGRSEGRMAARELADIVAYLKPVTAEAAALERTTLIGETVLVVESDVHRAKGLRAVLERAGAEVLLAHTAVEALPRVAQFEFSAAVVEWRPDTREHRTLIRWLREDGVRFLYRADRCPEAPGVDAGGAPVLPRSAPLHAVVAALARIAAAGSEVDAAVGQ